MFEGFFQLISSIFLFSAGYDTDDCFPKPLSADEENELLDRLSQGDISARNKLVEHNMRLVVHIAKKYTNYPDSDELISIGSIGLIKAINTFKRGKGTQLATYSARCIENEILMVLRAAKKTRSTISLYDSVGTDKDGNEMTYIDMLTGEDDEAMFEEFDRNGLPEKLRHVIGIALSEREQELICMRYGFGTDHPCPQKEVAEHFGISRSYVSRIETKALKKLRAYIEKHGL